MVDVLMRGRRRGSLLLLCIVFLSARAPFQGAVENAATVPAPPYLGVSYYPETAGAEMDHDISRMHEIGINQVRFGEFAWGVMEPREGEYDFSLQERALEKFAQSGIGVVLCTPTAAPPAWFSEKHPEILRVSAQGFTLGHGGRRQYCPNSEVYRAYSRRITEALGKRFGNERGVIAWQLDNEFYGDCFCPRCEREFRQWLRHRYGSIDELNQAWLTVVWSEQYQSFDQIPLPNPNRIQPGPHPSLTRAYREFMSDSYVSFSNEQAGIIRKYTKLPITTNAHTPIYQLIDNGKLFRSLDLVSMDCYAGPANLARYAFEDDWMRTLEKPFWLSETESSLAGAATVDEETVFVHARGALRAKIWLNYSLGADAVSFWLWRPHWAGQELEHGGLLYAWGDEAPNTEEIRQVGRELAQYGGWLSSTKPRPATVALHHSMRSLWNFDAAPIVVGFQYDTAIAEFHKQLLELGVHRDVIAPEAPVSGYRVVFSPFLPVIDEELLARMQRFVEGGGTWVLGPLSAGRTVDGTAHRDAAYGAALEQWLGVHVRHRLPPLDRVKLAADGGSFGARWWCDAYETGPAHTIWARYAGGALDGLPAVVEARIGKGRVILLGTLPEAAWLKSFLRLIAGEAPVEADTGIVAVERINRADQSAGWIVVNTSPKPGKVHLPRREPRELPGYGVVIFPAGEEHRP
jgi:beta-galactosidase